MSQQHERGTASTNKIVVVVDDDPRVRQSLESLLTSSGMDVRVYASAVEALHSGALVAAGCLIADVRMPVIDGWELQRLALAAYPSLPFIFVTAHQDESAYQRALSSGAFALFYKPFDGDDLVRAIDDAINSRAVSGRTESPGL